MHLATIKALYAGESKNGALSVTLIADIDGKEYTETQYVTNRNGENFFYDKEDKNKKMPLPGFVRINNLCQLLLGVELPNVDWAVKQLEVFDFEVRGKVRKALNCIEDVYGKQAYLAILRKEVNKEVSDGNGGYEPTAETRLINEWVGEAHAELKITVNEAEKAQAKGEDISEDHAQWYHSWIKNNVDEKDPEKARDARKLKDGQAGAAGAPKAGRADNGPPQAAAAAGSKPLGNLFNKK